MEPRRCERARVGASNLGTLQAQSLGGNITVNGTITASGAGDSIVLAAAGNFVNNAGAAALNPGPGRWLVWSTNPASDTRGGLAYAFKQYDATYGVTPVAGVGNGFLYSVAPSITPSLTGTVTKVYDGTTTATLTPGNYVASGAIDGDSVDLGQYRLGHLRHQGRRVSKNVPFPMSITGDKRRRRGLRLPARERPPPTRTSEPSTRLRSPATSPRRTRPTTATTRPRSPAEHSPA